MTETEVLDQSTALRSQL